MKLVLFQLEILTNSTARGKKKKRRKNKEQISGFVSVPTSVFLYRVDDLTEDKLCKVWEVGGSKRQKKYLLKGFTSGSQVEELESLSCPDSCQGELSICL